MSRTIDVIKGKNAIEKEMRQAKMNQISRLKRNASFMAGAVEQFKDISKILDSGRVESVTIKVSKENLVDFGNMLIESTELSGFDISQVNGKPDTFVIKNRYIKI